jgi:hypothetical protein
LFTADRAASGAEIPVRENAVALTWDVEREVPRLGSGAATLMRNDGPRWGGRRCINAFVVALRSVTRFHFFLLLAVRLGYSRAKRHGRRRR